VRKLARPEVGVFRFSWALRRFLVNGVCSLVVRLLEGGVWAGSEVSVDSGSLVWCLWDFLRLGLTG